MAFEDTVFLCGHFTPIEADRVRAAAKGQDIPVPEYLRRCALDPMQLRWALMTDDGQDD